MYDEINISGVCYVIQPFDFHHINHTIVKQKIDPFCFICYGLFNFDKWRKIFTFVLYPIPVIIHVLFYPIPQINKFFVLHIFFFPHHKPTVDMYKHNIWTN